MASSTSPPQSSEIIYTAPATTSQPPTLTGSANISIREYIYFLPHPLPPGTPVPYTPGLPDTNPLNLPPHPFEPTSTLVLTTPGKTFVDLRYLKPVNPTESPLPNHGETNRLEWGFAGTSSSVPSPDSPHDKYGPYRHCTWHSWLDSRYPVASPDIPPDEGDMYTLSPTRMLEHGHAFHAHLGRVAGHEEQWYDPAAASTSPSGTKVCVLLRCQDEARGVRGAIVRIGQFCQGIVQVGRAVSTERWEFDLDSQQRGTGGRGWRRTARTGEQFLPCAVTFEHEKVGLGGRVAYEGFEWVVEEVWEWE